VRFDDNEPYTWDTTHNDEVQKFIDAGPYVPPGGGDGGSGDDGLPEHVCTKAAFNGDYSRLDLVKFIVCPAVVLQLFPWLVRNDDKLMMDD
jgi:hypothetical protein